MLVTKITTHQQDAINRLLQQYQGRPMLTGWIGAEANRWQGAENALYPIDAARQIWNGSTTPAFGQWLDYIGQLVGIARNGLDDQQYTLFIFGKIAENFSDGTIADILTIVGFLFQAPTILIQPTWPAGIAVQVIGATIPVSLFKLAANLVQSALGAAINIVMAATPATPNVFRFQGPGVIGAINGFGDLNNPSIGGGFIGLIV